MPAGRLRRRLLEDFGHAHEELIAGKVAVKFVDPLEMVEVDQEQCARALGVERIADRPQQFPPIGKAGGGIGVGIAFGQSLGTFVGVDACRRSFDRRQPNRMMAMFSRNAMVRLVLGRRDAPKAGLSTWLPSPTNSTMAASVAQLMIRWLLAIRTELFFIPRHSLMGI